MHHYSTVDGVPLAYSRAGVGRPLLCLHGGMGIDGGTRRTSKTYSSNRK